jgi:hypothetical protein
MTERTFSLVIVEIPKGILKLFAGAKMNNFQTDVAFKNKVK